MFDPRAQEAQTIRRLAADERLGIRYIEHAQAHHHYTIVGEYGDETRILAQRLTSEEALAFLEGYRLGRQV